MLGNSRLLLLPLLLAAYLCLGTLGPCASPRIVVAGGALCRTVGRPQPGAGRLLRGHDRRARALEGEQRDTYTTLAGGGGSTTCPTSRVRRRTRERRRPLRRRGRRPSTSARRASLPRRGSSSGGSTRVRRRSSPSRRRMLWCRLQSRRPTRPGTGRLPTWARRRSSPLFCCCSTRSPSAGLRSSRHAVRGAASLLLVYNTLAAMLFAGTTRYRVPWDFVLALLAAFALERVWALLRARARRRGERRPVERLVRSVQRSSENPRARAPAPPHPTRRTPGRARARRSPPRGAASPRRDDEAGLAVGDDLGQPADVGRDRGATALRRLERDHAEALAERRDDDDRGALDRRARPARRGRGSSRRRRAEPRGRGRGARPRAARRRRSRGQLRDLRRAARTRAGGRRSP